MATTCLHILARYGKLVGNYLDCIFYFPIFTHADDSRVRKAFRGVCDSVCLSVCINKWMKMFSLVYRMIKNWLKASLFLHTGQLKEDNDKKIKQTLSGTESVKAVWSPVGSPVGRRGSMVRMICGTGVF